MRQLYTLLIFFGIHTIAHAMLQELMCTLQQKTDWGTPELIWAAQHCHAAEVLKILDNNGNPQEENACQETALHWGAYYSQINIVDHMLLFHANVNKPNLYGQTPLHWAFSPHTQKPKSHNQVVQRLLEAGAFFDAQDVFGKTPLHYGVIWPVTQSPFFEEDAYEKITVSSITLMAKWGADFNIQDSDGNTPLHIAILAALNVNLAKPIIHALTLMGADPNMANNDEITAKEIAENRWGQLGLECFFIEDIFEKTPQK